MMIDLRHMIAAGALFVLPATLAMAGSDEAPRSASGYVQPVPKPGHAYPECYCTDSRGQRVDVGQTACLQIGSRQVTSRCEKARNLVIWRHQTEGCAPGV